MTRATNRTELAPRRGLSASVSASGAVVGTERGAGAGSGPQTGAESLAGSTDLPPMLMTVLDGLVPLHLARLADLSEGDRRRLAERYADEIAGNGDRLVARGNFADRRERSRALTALAGAIALGALQPGGVTWAGRHWCTRPHPDCPVNKVHAA